MCVCVELLCQFDHSAGCVCWRGRWGGGDSHVIPEYSRERKRVKKEVCIFLRASIILPQICSFTHTYTLSVFFLPHFLLSLLPPLLPFIDPCIVSVSPALLWSPLVPALIDLSFKLSLALTAPGTEVELQSLPGSFSTLTLYLSQLSLLFSLCRGAALAQ